MSSRITCSGCGKRYEATTLYFSKSQLSKSVDKRKCFICVEKEFGGGVTPPSPPAAMMMAALAASADKSNNSGSPMSSSSNMGSPLHSMASPAAAAASPAAAAAPGIAAPTARHTTGNYTWNRADPTPGPCGFLWQEEEDINCEICCEPMLLAIAFRPCLHRTCEKCALAMKYKCAICREIRNFTKDQTLSEAVKFLQQRPTYRCSLCKAQLQTEELEAHEKGRLCPCLGDDVINSKNSGGKSKARAGK